MSDIFREVEEDVRRERLQKLWKQYGDYIIAAVALLVVAVAGYKVWQHYHASQIQKASAAYIQALENANSGKPQDAINGFARIAKTAPSGYAETAELAQANAVLASGKKAEAIALYRKIAEKHNDEIGQTARIRAAWAMADTYSKTDIQDILAPVNTDTSGWRFMAHEILAYTDFRNGKLKESLAAFTTLAKDKAAPDAIRQRAEAMATLMRNGVGDFGTLPAETDADKAAPAQATQTTP